MTPEQREKIQQVIANGYFHSSSLALRDGLKIYRSRFKDFALFAMIVPFVGSLFSLLGIPDIGSLILMLFVAPVLNAGFYLAADSSIRQEKWHFNRLFEARKHAPALIINTMVTILITGLVLTPMYFLFERIGLIEWYYDVLANPQKPPAPPEMTSTESTSFFLNLLPLIYLQVGFSWAFPLILFYGANGFNALEYSRRLVTRRWGAQFMLLLTFLSFFMLASMLLSPITAIHPGLANVVSFALFLLFPWAYCSLLAGFYRAMNSPTA